MSIQSLVRDQYAARNPMFLAGAAPFGVQALRRLRPVSLSVLACEVLPRSLGAPATYSFRTTFLTFLEVLILPLLALGLLWEGRAARGRAYEHFRISGHAGRNLAGLAALLLDCRTSQLRAGLARHDVVAPACGWLRPMLRTANIALRGWAGAAL